ncbi:patatin-like phospholipase family protein [Geomonas sp. RF6]|uniref:patatin-like phospholipase family protein n=1 Tax=Geomonas sp. RF6 TaxID=2897342 RepID=UPI001E34C733|nr:patatin-like phospholipase family protein [Geomonas sp. RF6]UFS72106.1 patatin-like phospholipase family protein [Geomonas sp. RF6]
MEGELNHAKLTERIERKGAKKILALDGGGIRGMMSVQVLIAIEDLLRKELQKDESFRLADYFDFVSGTSTGAIIAACISLGMKARDIEAFYINSGKEMFDEAFLLDKLRYKFEDEKLARKLREVFDGDEGVTYLGSAKLKTLLMMVMRNATTDSPWPICNNPKAKYNDLSLPDCNLKLPLWQLVRASTAAPVYFPPEVLTVGEHRFIFVDGGITPYNNPAFQTFLMATTQPYNLNWQAGVKDMLVVSIGTGTSPGENEKLKPSDMNVLYNAGSIPSALMFAALNEQDFLCRVFGDCVCGDPLDSEVGDMMDMRGPGPKLFTYARYNAELTRNGLDKLGLPNIKPKDVQKLDSVDHIADLQQVGQAVAKQKVKREHFERFL